MDRKDGGFRKYRVKVWLLEEEYDVIAEDEKDAFIQASDAAISGGSWGCEVEEIEDEE